MIEKTDFLILGGGIIGLCIAKALREKYPEKKITILEKEVSLGYHASGRNSGVLHAGFYYAADSLKAKFTLEGNRAWKTFCKSHQLPLNENGKVVVAIKESDIAGVHTLYQRGLNNNIPLQLITAKELNEIEPNAKTCEVALYSPETATISPPAIIKALQLELMQNKVDIILGEAFVKRLPDGIILSSKSRQWQAEKIINAAGLYADQIAKQFDLAKSYIIMPFKGLYVKYTGTIPPVKVNVYPVPDLAFPFLGVHFTVTVNQEVKIGPTALPCFWRENYVGWERFNLTETLPILIKQAQLFWGNSFNFRTLALTEMKKMYKPYFVKQAENLVKELDKPGFTQWTKPGIRAQLLDLVTGKLVQDFVIEQDTQSVHVLNAVSPAFTCALPFSQWLVDHYL